MQKLSHLVVAKNLSLKSSSFTQKVQTWVGITFNLNYNEALGNAFETDSDLILDFAVSKFPFALIGTSTYDAIRNDGFLMGQKIVPFVLYPTENRDLVSRFEVDNTYTSFGYD